MIYVIKEVDDYFDLGLESVYESEHEDLSEKYNNFIQREADKFNIKIYGYWHQIGSYNKEMSKTEYNRISKEWRKFIKTWNFEYFINHFELAKKVEFKQVLQK